MQKFATHTIKDRGYCLMIADTSSQTCKKIIFVREPNFGQKNVWTIYLENSLSKGYKSQNKGCFMYEYIEIGNNLTLIFSI